MVDEAEEFLLVLLPTSKAGHSGTVVVKRIAHHRHALYILAVVVGESLILTEREVLDEAKVMLADDVAAEQFVERCSKGIDVRGGTERLEA